MNQPGIEVLNPFLFRCSLFMGFLFLFPFANFAVEPGEFHIPSVMPLDDVRLERLRKLVQSDSGAQALAREIRESALPLLGSEPLPLEKIDYEGLVNTDPRRVACVEKLKQTGDAARLLRYWQISADAKAAERLRSFINAWAETYQPTGNDVNENKLYPLLVAYMALRGKFEPAEREKIDRWVDQLGTLHLKGVKRSRHFTNRYSKHVRLLCICANILGRDEWLEEGFKGIRRYVTRSLYPDGSSLDFKRRDTLTYHCSALKPVLELAITSGPKGRELYAWESPKGGSLKKSVDFVVPYAMGEKTHKEWVNSKVQLDHRRAEAGLEKYRPGRLFDPQDSLTLMEYASYFDPELKKVILHLGGADKNYHSWLMLMNAVSD